jgi:hypothetical protein
MMKRWHMCAQFAIFHQYAAAYCIPALISVMIGCVAVTPSWGSANNAESTFIHLAGENQSLKSVFSEITAKTGYKVIFDLDEQLKKARFTFKCENESIFQALKKIVKKAGVENFVIVADEKNRSLKVINFDHLTSMQGLSVTHPHDTGLTAQQLKALRKEQKKKIQMMNQNPDEIVIPLEGSQPGITRAQLQAFHKRQKK